MGRRAVADDVGSTAKDCSEAAWGRKYPAIIKLWNSAWAEFVPFLNFDIEIRRVVCTRPRRKWPVTSLSTCQMALNIRFASAFAYTSAWRMQPGPEKPTHSSTSKNRQRIRH